MARRWCGGCADAGSAILQLHVVRQPVAEGSQQFAQGDQMLPGELITHPGTGVEAPQLPQRVIRRRPVPVRRALKGVIVQQDQFAVTGEVNVGLDLVHTHVDGPLEGGHRVLRCVA